MSSAPPTDSVALRLTEPERHRLERVERLATLLDNAIPIPGTRFRIGLDPLLGLLPGLGDALGALASAWILVEAARLGASRTVLARMLYNIAVDTLIGAVPGAGDLFDFVWKSDAKNVALLRRHLEQPDVVHRASRRLLLAVLVLIAGAAVVSVVAAILLIRFLLTLPTHT
ncbi:MAG TPA: DUF4112 domain-containing protein [Gemmatimonadales bacterium]|jgi:hypothetical protein|nr:DUF4112 domain-containing protein [Gemmatimonadales bacterium]